MKFDFKFTSKDSDSLRSDILKARYELDAENFEENISGEINLPDQWCVGLIVGSSGSGKTTIINDLFKDQFWNDFRWSDNPLIDDFDETLKPDDVFAALSKVGFNSPPFWMKKFSVLSNGQKMRVELARLIAECPQDKIAMFDEFTSVVDRQVAKIASSAISKYVRKNNRKFLAVSCHRDIIEWLQPDWVYDTDERRFFFTKNQQDQAYCSASSRLKKKDGITIGDFTI